MSKDRLPDLLESVARLRVKVAGVLKGARRELDFTSNDSSVTITATDDGVNEKLTVDFAAAGGDALWDGTDGDLTPLTQPHNFTVYTDTGSINLTAADGMGVTVIDENFQLVTINGHIFLTVGGGQIILTGIPTSDPGVSGALWSSSGTLKISP